MKTLLFLLFLLPISLLEEDIQLNAFKENLKSGKIEVIMKKGPSK